MSATAQTPIPIDRRTVSIETTARELGMSRGLAYELARRDALPVPVIRLGERRMVVSRAALDAVLTAGTPHSDVDVA